MTSAKLDERPSGLKLSVFWLCMVLLVAVAAEGVAALAYRSVILPRAPFLIWNPDLDAVRQAWVANAALADEELGWPSLDAATASPRDRTGAKFNPDFPEPGHACMSGYGDSFIWGEEIPLADGLIEQLARKLGCRIANYGVSGYGTDQAFLRFRRFAQDEAPVVLLGIFPENLMRNVNQYRGFLGYSLQPQSLKGRALIDAAGRLEWLPRPKLDAEGFVRLHVAPATVVPHEYLMPDTRDGPVTRRFSHVETVLRVALMPRVLAHFSGGPASAEFFSADHPSGALPLTIAITEEFVRLAEQRGKRPLIVLFPGANSFRARDHRGDFDYAPLLAGLKSVKIDVFDVGQAVTASLGARSFCTLYVKSDCSGHYGVQGSAIVADVIADELYRRGLIKR